MNWEKIKKKYPKSVSLLTNGYMGRDWIVENKCLGCFVEVGIRDTGILSNEYWVWTPWELRDLYDFFDSQGVWVDVTYETNGWEPPPWFQGCVYSIPEILTKQYTSRRKAEKAVFKKAFKVLEHKLKQN